MSTRGRALGWRRTITLKDLLGPEDDDATVRRVAAKFAERLGRVLPKYSGGAYDDLADVIAEFKDIAEDAAAGEYTARWTRSRHFNDVLDALYDWADAERVWIA